LRLDMLHASTIAPVQPGFPSRGPERSPQAPSAAVASMAEHANSLDFEDPT
jgi:hypothetical protein